MTDQTTAPAGDVPPPSGFVVDPAPVPPADDSWDTGVPVAHQDAPVPAGFTLDAPAPVDDSWDTGVPVSHPEAPLPNAGITSRFAPSRMMTPQEQLIDLSPLGRILDAFGQGAKNAWGAEPLGISPEYDAELRRYGVFNELQGTHSNILKTFNEAIIRPAAAAGDLLFRRLLPTTIGAISGATGQASVELGMQSPDDAKRMTRELNNMGEAALIVLGTPEAAGALGVGIPRGAPVPIRAVPEARLGTLADEAANIPRPIQPAPVATASAWEQALRDAGIRKPQPAPVTAPTQPFLKPAAPMVDNAGNINLGRINAPNDVKQVIQEAAEANPGFNPLNTRGKISLAQTEDMAHALGMTPDMLLKRGIGDAFNAETATAARNLLVQSAVDVRTLAGKAAGGTEGDLLAFQEALTRHSMIQEQVSGITAEAGRALSSFRIMASGAKDAQAISRLVQEVGGRDGIENLARAIGELETPQQVSKFVADSRKATTMDMIQEAWINALLSNPVTHVKNVLSNTGAALWRTGETGLAGGFGLLRGAPADRVYFGEAGARLTGMVQGSIDGIRAAGKSLVHEGVTSGASKMEQSRQAIPGIGGQIARIPGRALEAEDALFKAIGYRQSLNAQAYRAAARAQLTGDAFHTRVATLLQNPTEKMLARARAEADYQTFTKPLGKAGQAVQTFLKEYPVLKFIVPFVRTPANLIKFAGERTVLSAASKEVRDILAGKHGAAARDEQLAKMVLGTAASATAFTLAAGGQITGGGPSDPAERALWRMTGWQPYSVKIGNTYHSYAWLEPIATLFGVAADAAEIADRVGVEDAGDISKLIAFSAASNVTSKTWLQGLANLVDATQDPERYGPGFVNKFVGSFVPAGIAQAARMEDPYLRDARNIVDTIKSRVPGMSKDLPFKRNIWGEPIQREGATGPDALSPIYKSQVKNDPIAQELLSLGMFPAALDRQIRGVDLTPKQYDDFQRIAGRLTRYTLEQLVQTPGWGDLPAYLRADVLRKSIDRTREAARRYMLMANPDLLRAAAEAKMKALTGE